MLDVKILFTKILQRLKITPFVKALQLTSAGSTTISPRYGLGSDNVAIYLISCARYSVDTDTNSGLYLVMLNKSSGHYSVSAIKSATGVTVTASASGITVTTTVTYIAVSAMKVF